jgi:hypothetical protein
MSLIPDDTYCALSPRAYFDIAETVRAAQKSGAPVGRAGFPTPLSPAPELSKAHRVYLQSDWDPVRTAGFGAHAYAVSGADVVRFTRVDEVEKIERPLVAERSRIGWAALGTDGSAAAGVGGKLLEVDAAGRIAERGPDPFPLRADELPLGRPLAVRIGQRWFQARGALRPLGDARPPLRALPEGSVLVGGASEGLVVEIGSGTMTLTRLDPDRGVLTHVADVRAPVGLGFDATIRARGGAIVAGIDPRGGVTAFAVDAAGHATTPTSVPLPIDRARPTVRLVALPGGGALLSDLDRTHVVWLDDDGRALADAAWPHDRSDARCVDGRPAETEIPSPQPGRFVHVENLATKGTCIVGDPVWTSTGSLVWLGSTASGPHTRAELGRVDLGAQAAEKVAAGAPTLALPAVAPAPCPSDMVSVRGRYCVDRFEGALADASTGALLSPDVSVSSASALLALGEWSTRRERVGDLFARALPLPFVPPSQLDAAPTALAVSRAGVRPSGYVTGIGAKAACSAAHKRLCTLDEWKTACRGEADRLFPYGDDYEDGACNVNREAHPAGLLHGHASMGHLDPRLNYVAAAGSPLFHATGESPRCASRWGDDAIYDMVGNLDEWVDEGAGAFAGGFYSRGTKSGCGALVDNHPASYLDYSTGVRCCRDAEPTPATSAPGAAAPRSPGG